MQQQFDRAYANRTLAYFAVLAAFVMYVEMMLTPSLPRIAADYGVTSSQVSLVLSLYTVFGTAVAPVVGKLGDIHGKKKVLTYVLIMYVIMVTSTSFSPSYSYLLASRTLQGVGLSIFPLAFSLVREEFPRDLIPRAQGLLSAMFAAGAAIGLPVGAYISNSLGWQSTYHTAVPFIVVLTVLIIWQVRESNYRNPGATLDRSGALMLGLALALIVFALSEGSSWGWTSAPVVTLFVIGFALFGPLIYFERRKAQPILNLVLLGKRNVFVSNVLGLVSGMAMFLAFQALTFQLELPPPAGLGYDILSTGLFILPFALVVVIIALPVGIAVSRIGVRPFVLVGALIAAAGFAFASVTSDAAGLSTYLMVIAAGMGMQMVAIQNLLVLSVSPREMGLATSLNTVFRNVGTSLGAPIAGSLISTYTTWYYAGNYKGVPLLYSIPSKIAFQYSYDVAVIAFVAGFFVTFLSREVIGRWAQKGAAVELNDDRGPQPEPGNESAQA